MDDHHSRYAIQSDIRHFYDTIDTDVLKDMLRRDVNNEPLLHLTFFLIDTFIFKPVIGLLLSIFGIPLCDRTMLSHKKAQGRNRKPSESCRPRIVVCR